MKPFKIYRGRTVAIMNDNIDTDILIPKQYLKSVRRTGFGAYVFAPWRYDDAGKPVPDFPLNRPEYEGASILISGDNFGCGSSREHAAWALQDFGIRVVIAGGYSDIFYNNWLNNGHLPIVLPASERAFLAELTPEEEIEVDLAAQEVRARDRIFSFDFPPRWKQRLMEGKDGIDLTLTYIDDIEAYEAASERTSNTVVDKG
ncbi:MAG: 3-isopropylmalate dehydratase small subunit [Eubacteriales bacterium]|nr:3-isopropylmalate dehydratase small subunit [Eubacteriales bacterium]